MNFLSIHIGHDANFSIYYNEKIKYFKCERISGIKHDAEGSADLEKNIINFIKKNKIKIDLISFTFGDFNYYSNSDEKEIKLYEYNDSFYEFEKSALEKKKSFSELGCIPKRFISLIDRNKKIIQKLDLMSVPCYWVHHSYCHILCGLVFHENFEYGVLIDGGSPDFINKLIIKNPFKFKEIKVLFYSRSFEKKDDKTIEQTNTTFGGVWGKIGLEMGLKGNGLDFAGKIMGLQSYGKIDYKIIKDFKKELKNINYFKIIKFWVKIKNNIKDKKFKFENKEFLSLIATFHKVWELSVLKIFKNFIPKKSNVIYSGGCAQNTVTNMSILKRYPHLEIIPHCYDGGLSLGSLYFILLKKNLKIPKIKNFPYIQTDEAPPNEPNEKTIKKVATILAQGGIIGWYQGHGEIGPRALGNRSILMNPSIKNGKEILNSKVKHREHWRPYAPSVLEEHACNWFDITKSKHMMFAAQVKKDKQKTIPSVTHEDGTSRIQTVNEDDNIHFYNLIKEFYKITNIPMLLNTSLNEGGGPIIGSVSEAKNFFKNSNLDAICIGNNLLIKKYL